MHRARVLVVEDDDGVAAALIAALALNGYAPQQVSTSAAALGALRAGGVDLVLLDRRLPDGDGEQVCRSIRAASAVPVIMVTARGEERMRVEGLRAGADDYIVKPFGMLELLARIEAVLRRSAPVRGLATSRHRLSDQVVLDAARHALLVGNSEERHLPRRELALLLALLRSHGGVVRRDELARTVWGGAWAENSRTLDVHVAALRAKLGDRELIETVRGVGYRWTGLAEREA